MTSLKLTAGNCHAKVFIDEIEVGIACKQHKPQQDTELMGRVLACFSCTV